MLGAPPTRTMLLVAGILLSAPALHAQAAEKTVGLSTALLKQHCFDCHGEDGAEANVNLVAAAGDAAAHFRTWEKAIGVLQSKRMPPPDVSTLSEAERKQLSAGIRGELDGAIRKGAGDPGRVALRRLTSAEYACTIRDLTGLVLDFDQTLIGDAVGGEGFTNVGDVQFMQDAALERYLEAARLVASHAVIGADRLSFFPDPGRTGRELSAIHRIQQIYREHGFRTGAGEGAKPFGLDQYPRAFFVAWQHRHAQPLGLKSSTLAELARAEGLSVGFVEHIHGVLQQSDTRFPTSAIVSAWQDLPPPADDNAAFQRRIREKCEAIYATMHDWQSLLAAAAGDEEESPVLTAESFRVQSQHSFKADLHWNEGSTKGTVEFAVASARREKTARSQVIWRDPSVRFRTADMRWTRREPLSNWLTDASVGRLSLGSHPAGRKIGRRDFVVATGAMAPCEFRMPRGARFAEMTVEIELDLEHGDDDVVRCSISDGEVEGETAAETGTTSAMLGNPQSESFGPWKAGVLEFADKLPQVSHREPAPSDRDPIPAPFDNTYNMPERNLFHYKIKYHRDDEFLVRHMLDEETRKRLDLAWTDLLTSFEYYDANLQFLAGKYKLDLQGRSIADLEDEWIDQLPAEPRAFVKRWHADHLSAQSVLKGAELEHVDDAISFARLAWRRPLRDEEQRQLRAFYRQMRDDAELDHADALRALLARILVAPAFLYRAETPQQAGIAALSNWELANRLSYFLWSSMPDDELRRAAAAGELAQPEQFAEQARRMLRDSKARRFSTEFFGQWFGFYRFDGYGGIDAQQFPEFTGELKTAMHEEAVSFFDHIVRENRPPREILFADYAFLNDRLARHYGIKPKPALDETLALVEDVGSDHRGGLLGLGAVLSTTSAPLRTSPVKRGDWILRRVLGTPVPPPPADAGSIAPGDVLTDGQTVRERLVAHRREAACVNCHARIDPLGFALENYDAIGRWRERYADKREVDTTGILSDGTKITGPDGLREYLKDREADFERTLCVKLLGYALGRSELITDRPLIDEMTADLRDDGRFADLVTRIVTSRQFRNRRGRLPAVGELE